MGARRAWDDEPAGVSEGVAVQPSRRTEGCLDEACSAGLRLPTRSWGVCECWMVLEEAGEGSIYRRAARVLWAPPVDTCPRRPATSDVSERGRRRGRSRGHCGRTETSTGSRGWRRAQCAPHCWAGRTLPVLPVASSGVGERQGGVNGVEMMMVARFGTLRQAGKRATEARARRRARRMHASTPGRTRSPCEL